MLEIHVSGRDVVLPLIKRLRNLQVALVAYEEHDVVKRRSWI
jgi:hypothetical protein